MRHEGKKTEYNVVQSASDRLSAYLSACKLSVDDSPMQPMSREKKTTGCSWADLC